MSTAPKREANAPEQVANAPEQVANAPEQVANAPGPYDRLVWGLGTGRHLLAALRRGERVLVLAIDHDPAQPERARAVVQDRVELTAAEAAGRLEIVVATPEGLSRGFERASATGDGLALDVHLPSLMAAPAAAQPLARVVERVHLEHVRAAKTRDRLRQNLRANLELLAHTPSLRALQGLGAGHPAFVLAAGPSARRAVGWLPQLRGYGPVLAVDTILPLCATTGLRVDVVVSCDPHPESRDHLRSGAAGGALLAFQPYCDPEVVRSVPHRVVAVPRGDQLFDEVAAPLELDAVETRETVLLYAIEVAQSLGAAPIVLIGADLAFVDGFTHARGTARARTQLEAPHFVTNTKGEPVPTSRTLLRFHSDLEAYLRMEGLEVWAVDGGGAAIRGATMMTSDTLATRLSARFDTPDFDGRALATLCEVAPDLAERRVRAITEEMARLDRSRDERVK